MFNRNLNLVRKFAGGIVLMTGLYSQSFAEEIIRKPAVAGQFYNSDAGALEKEIGSYLKGCNKNVSNSRLLICPHAGYMFSGPVAASGFAAMDKNTRRVFLIGPSHYQYIDGIGITAVDYYQTPLGKIKVDREITDKLLADPDVDALSLNNQDREHCIEVQLPFLQVVLNDNFSIVQILTGNMDPKSIADLIFPYIDDNRVVMASSDFSHYYSQDKARKVDDKTIETILSGNTELEIDACGKLAIKAVMYLAKRMKLSPILQDARTSYETAPAACSKSRVVGYASIAYCSGKNEKISQNSAEKRTNEKDKKSFFEPHIKKILLDLARENLEAAVYGKKAVIPKVLPPQIKENRGCFVTLTIDGQLRGCIGYIEPIKPLYQAVMDNACNAALKDTRFTPVKSKELEKIKVEVSVLTRPQILQYTDPDDLLNKLIPGVHGVILEKGPYKSTFLPQVWESLPDKKNFLQHLSIKGGMDSDGWKTANVKTYKAFHFQEP